MIRILENRSGLRIRILIKKPKGRLKNLYSRIRRKILIKRKTQAKNFYEFTFPTDPDAFIYAISGKGTLLSPTLTDRSCRPRPFSPPSTPRPRRQPRPPSRQCTEPASDGQLRRTKTSCSRSRCRASPQPPRTFRRNIFLPTTRYPSSWAHIPSTPTHSLTIPASSRISSRRIRNSPSAICSKTGTAPAT